MHHFCIHGRFLEEGGGGGRKVKGRWAVRKCGCVR